MPEMDTDPGLPDQLTADLKALRKRVLSAPVASDVGGVHKYFVGIICHEVIPAIIAANERIIEVDELVEEMVEQQESYLTEEDTAQLISTIQIGGAILAEIQKHLESFDDVAKKRFVDMMRAYENSAQHSLMIISSAAADPDESGDSEDEDGSDDTPAEDESDE